jgi:hypothetical protein
MSKKYHIEYRNGVTSISFNQRPTYSDFQNAFDDIVENFPYEL